MIPELPQYKRTRQKDHRRDRERQPKPDVHFTIHHGDDTRHGAYTHQAEKVQQHPRPSRQRIDKYPPSLFVYGYLHPSVGKLFEEERRDVRSSIQSVEHPRRRSWSICVRYAPKSYAQQHNTHNVHRKRSFCMHYDRRQRRNNQHQMRHDSDCVGPLQCAERPRYWSAMKAPRSGERPRHTTSTFAFSNLAHNMCEGEATHRSIPPFSCQ
jgi:hypothetical protein